MTVSASVVYDAWHDDVAAFDGSDDVEGRPVSVFRKGVVGIERGVAKIDVNTVPG